MEKWGPEVPDVGSLERRVERLEERVDNVTEKLYDRIRALEIRMAFYAGIAAVVAAFLSSVWGSK